MAHVKLPSSEVVKLTRESGSPLALALILTHILQMDFVKWPIKPSRMAGCITISTISFRSTSEPKKMWVRNRPKRRGLLRVGYRCVVAPTQEYFSQHSRLDQVQGDNRGN